MADKTEPKGAWKGYTLSELEYQRAMTMVRIEIQKERLSDDIDRIRKGNFNMVPAQFSRAVGVMKYLDYGILAFKVIRKVTSVLRKKKK